MKTYKLTHYYLNGKTELTGTVPELAKACSYALMCGNSWDATINPNPKTARGLENALNKSAVACRRYNDSYTITAQK